MDALETIVEVAPRLRRKEVSPVELTRACLDRIEKLNPALNAFITVTAESALAEARAAEIEISRGEWRGPLHGIPVALKDLIDTAGTRTTAASALYRDRVPAEDAEVVRRLRRAGAVILGKNNLHEFAYGGSSLVSFFGDIHNPWNAAHVAGRIVWRIGGCCGCRALLCGDWDGYGWIDPRTGCVVRVRGDQADLWARVGARGDSAFVVARSCWSADRDSWRCGGCAAGYCGIRSARRLQC